jgi:hypothetical protein
MLRIATKLGQTDVIVALYRLPSEIGEKAAHAFTDLVVFIGT